MARLVAHLPTSVRWVLTESKIFGAYIGGSSAQPDKADRSDLDLFVVFKPSGEGLLERCSGLVASHFSGSLHDGPNAVFGYGLQYKIVDRDANFIDLFFQSSEGFTPNPMMIGNLIVRDTKGFLASKLKRASFLRYRRQYERFLWLELLWQFRALQSKLKNGQEFQASRRFLAFLEVAFEVLHACDAKQSTKVPFYTAFKSREYRQALARTFDVEHWSTVSTDEMHALAYKILATTFQKAQPVSSQVRRIVARFLETLSYGERS